jgi:SpoVK/Ycf46/Vps4 family AAA+-type ATPase
MDHQLFDTIIEFPDKESEKKYQGLIGLNDIKDRLIKEAQILLNPILLADWSLKKYGKIIPLVKLFDNRHALFIFAGDIGTGKTTLAESFGDYLSRNANISIALFSLSLNARGDGGAGELTKFISRAFQEIKIHMQQLRNPSGTYASACVLLIDEADALAQSRDLITMLHEDRAGVDSLIQGIDSINEAHLPVIIILCTNRLNAIDPAVRRRAAAIFEFNRPSEEQRLILFRNFLEGTELTEDDFKMLAHITGENEKRNYGYTYSDIVQNILPALLLETFPDQQITKDKIIHLIEQNLPTPPFNEGNR